VARQYRFENPFESQNIQINARKVIPLVIAALVLLIILVGMFTCYHIVQPEGKAVVKRFGMVIDIREPGLHFKLPFGIDHVHFVPTERVLKEEFGFATTKAGQRSQYVVTDEHRKQSLMLTGDLNVIDVAWVVQYRIKDPDKYLHRLRNQRETIRIISESVMRRIIGNRLGGDALTVGRSEIAILAQQEMQRILDTYEMGVGVSTIELQDVTPPDPVEPAYNDVNDARQEKQRLINEAETRRNQAIPRAEGNALKMIAQAEGYRSERINRAKGDASRFVSLYKQYKRSPEITRQRLYLEMIDQVMPRVGKVYVLEKGHTAPIPLLNLGGDQPAALPRKGHR